MNPTYEFLALEEVEQFIEKNHHLPGVPSAIELEKEGASDDEIDTNPKILQLLHKRNIIDNKQ